MKRDKPRAYVTNPESELPIRAVIGGREYSFALVSARKLALDLSAAVKAVDEHFQCSHPSTESVSLLDFLMHLSLGLEIPIRCASRGTVRIGKSYYCKVHARKISKEQR